MSSREAHDHYGDLLRAQAAAGTLPEYDGLKFTAILADSGQARVYRGTFKGRDVAAKVFHVEVSALRAFRDEIAALLYVLWVCIRARTDFLFFFPGG